MRRDFVRDICRGGVLLGVIAQTAFAATLTSIKIQPTADKLLAGQTIRLKAMGTFSDGTTTDITSRVKWTISNTSVAKISAAGVVSIAETTRGAGMGGLGNRQGNRSRQAGGPPAGGMGGPDMSPPDDGMGGPGMPPPDEGMGGPGMPPPDEGVGGPDMPPPDEGMGGPDMPPPGEQQTDRSRSDQAGQNDRQNRGSNRPNRGPGGPGGPGGGGMGGPGGPGGEEMPSGSVVSITAGLDNVASAPISLTVLPVEGPATYSQNGSTASKFNQKIKATDKNTSAVKISNNSMFTLSDSTLVTTGDTTNMDYSSFYGLNAALLALSGSKVRMTNGSIITTGLGANGAFAVGKGTVVDLFKVKIECSAGGAHGVDATIAGTVNCTDVDIKTSGNGAAAAIATDRGGGTITFTRGNVLTKGTRSPAVYSTGVITVSDARLEATNSEGVVIEGKNSVTLNNVTLLCQKQCGAMLYQSFSGDAGVGTSVLKMAGGALTAAEGPMFYITNTQAVVEIKGDAKLTATSGVLIKAAADQWGRSGSNGGGLTFQADGETLAGNVVCDNISTVAMTLQNKTTLKGTINSDNAAKEILLTLDAGSVWDVTGDSYVTSLMDADTTLANIHSNGHTISYDAHAEANAWLGGKTVSLDNGGKLVAR